MRETTYRGYRIVPDEDSGYVEIWHSSELIARADTTTQAEWAIDEWIEGSVR